MRFRPSRRTWGSVLIAAVLAATVLAGTSQLVLAATVVVNTIPGGGWIQSPDNNTGGGTAVLAAGPAGGLGIGSVHVTTAATGDFAGLSRPLVGTLANLTGGSWMTFVTGDTGNPSSEAASLRFAMLRTGTDEFTTMTVELSENRGATPGAWQTTTLTDQSMVWQTNDTNGATCLIASPCTLATFKGLYPQAVIGGLRLRSGRASPRTHRSSMACR